MWSTLARRRLRRTTLISFGSLAFLAGIGLSRAGLVVPLGVALGSTVLLWLCRRRRLVVALPVVLVVGVLLGLGRGADMMRQVDVYARLAGHKTELTGTVVQDSTYGNKRQIDFMIDHVRVDGHELPGQVRVTSFEPVEPKQGDTVRVSGKAMPGFGNYQLGMYYSHVQVTGRGDSWLGWLRRQFSAAILNVLPEPQASLGLGFLLGIKSQLPDSLNDQLKIVGLTHIVVASGYNLTILVRVARRAFAARSKYQATAAAVALMCGFVGITGFSPSMTRAALVTSLSLAAWYYGRVIHPVLILLFSAAVTAAWNPLYVWGDIGWYLSFLAFGGVMLGAPLLTKRLFGERKVPQLAQIAIETLCAELAALPLTLFVFGSMSVVGFVANLVVTPLVPLAMLATFVAGAGVWLWPGPGAWLALPAQWVLSYMTSMVSLLAGIPWARQSVGLPLPGLVVAYAALVGVSFIMWRKLRYNYLVKSIVE